MALGATFLSGLTGGGGIPSFSGGTSSAASEGGNIRFGGGSVRVNVVGDGNAVSPSTRVSGGPNLPAQGADYGAQGGPIAAEKIALYGLGFVALLVAMKFANK